MRAVASVAAKSLFAEIGTVLDAARLPVDCSGAIWRLNSASRVKTIYWENFQVSSDGILAATVNFIRHLVETQSSSSVCNTFSAVVLVLRSQNFERADLADGIIPLEIFSELRTVLEEEQWRLHYVRQWYGWCAEFGFPNFSMDVAFEADQLKFGGNEKGQAVLSAHPEEGPLSDSELAALLTALRAARGRKVLTLEQEAALWLCVALGPNPLQMAMLCEEDVVRINDIDSLAFVHLRVPRMKKGENEVRASFRVRGLTKEIADVVLELINQNAATLLLPGAGGPRSRPVFLRMSGRPDLIDGPLDHYSWHISATEFTQLIVSAVAALGVRSPRTGKDLRVTTRRLRYTFATRLVREGVSKLEVADLLDHTDTQNVQVYFDIKSDIVEHLDKAVAMALAPMAQAFMGNLIHGAVEAVRGDDPDSTIATVAGTPGHVEKLGNCGLFGFCGATAPVACYTCRMFQAWIDAPHGVILDHLLKDRDRKVAAGLDGRMISMHDTTICAIAEVISRIEALQAEQA